MGLVMIWASSIYYNNYLKKKFLKYAVELFCLIFNMHSKTPTQSSAENEPHDQSL